MTISRYQSQSSDQKKAYASWAAWAKSYSSSFAVTEAIVASSRESSQRSSIWTGSASASRYPPPQGLGPAAP